MPTAIVIGAGLTGLSAALALKKKGWDPIVLEERHEAGGVIRTHRENGWLVEAACSSLQLKSEAMERIVLQEAGLSEELIEPRKEAGNRYIVRNGKPIPVPSGPFAFLTTPLWTLGGKWRFFGEAFVPKGSQSRDETIAQFVRRRCGPEFYDYGINPLVSGIHAGDPERLSMRLAFPKVWELEDQHGGLIRGALARMVSGKKPRFRKRLISFRNGMQALPQALERKLGNAVRYRVQLLQVQPSKNGHWEVTYKTGNDTTKLTTEKILITTPLWRLRDLPLPSALAESLAPLQKVNHAPVATIALGYRKEQVSHPLDGFGVLVPTKEKRHILGTLFHSSLFPHRAPEGHVLLTTFIGGMQSPQYVGMAEERLENMAHEESSALLKIHGHPVYRKLFRWPHAIPQYHTDYDQYLMLIKKIEQEWSGLSFAGNYRGGIAAGDCLVNGWEAGERISANA